MMPRIQAVVFDLDGLLIDSEPIFAEVARRLLARRRLAPDPAILRRMMGTPARAALALLVAHHELTESIDDLNTECIGLFFEILGEQPVPLLNGVAEFLDLVERHDLPKAIATSSSARYLERVLTPHGLLTRFQFALTCDDVTHGKPHPEVYLAAATRFAINPAAMLVLEDSPNGLRAAKAAGARCVVVPHGLVPREEIQSADLIVDHLGAPELAALFT
jgi:HAD superfamily hydrolase (TIGR01509 family)